MTKRNAIILFGPIERERHEILAAILTQLTIFVKNPTVIDFYKKGKLLKLLYTQDIKNVHVRKVDLDIYDNWDDLENNAELIMRQFRNVFIFCLPCVDGFNFDDYSLVTDFIERVSQDKQFCIKSHGIGNLYKRIAFIKHCYQNKRCIHLLLDPREAFLDKCFGFTNYKRFYFLNGLSGSEYFPYFEYGLVNTYCQFIPKYNVMCFIGSDYSKEKSYLRHLSEKMNISFERTRKYKKRNSRCKMLLYTREDKQNRMYQNEYYYDLMLSKYTFIPRTYYGDTFNYIRFIESVVCNCVPLILPDCYIDDFSLTFNDMYDIIIKNNLYLSYKDISLSGKNYYQLKIQNRFNMYDEDKQCIQEIKETASWKTITNYDFVQQAFNSLLGVKNV